MNRKEIFTIPNILGYIRILLVPVFAGLYLNGQYTGAIAAMAVSILSDFFDGMIARKFNQITELGKFLDPVADKLTQVTMIFCLASHFQLVWILAIIVVIKEGFMGAAGLFMLRKRGRKLDGAKWYGKISTAITDLAMFALLLFPSMPAWLSSLLIGTCAAGMVMAILLYIPDFYQMWIQPHEQNI